MRGTSKVLTSLRKGRIGPLPVLSECIAEHLLLFYGQVFSVWMLVLYTEKGMHLAVLD
jgi:hypothetical protein